MRRYGWLLAGLLVLTLSAAASMYLMYNNPWLSDEPLPETQPEELARQQDTPPTPEVTVQEEVIGTSVEGRSIRAHSIGSGDTHVLLVGGIHGGYEWNSVLLAYELIDHLENDPSLIPENLTVTIVPSANPDGLFAVVGKEGRFAVADVPEDEGPLGTGRFNANDVDLNRNFGCKWQPESTWRGNVVSAGTAAFSEPEARAIRDLALETQPRAVVFFHSQSNAVYASECENGILPETRTVMNLYSNASGYPAVDVFDAYEITGDAEGWLASIGIPAITVELSTHETIEWERNRAGVMALVEHFAAVEK